MSAAALKRKRSSDVASECTHTTECTEASQAILDEKSQQLADKRAQHAAEKLELERHMQQLVEQRQHVAAQLEQLEGCEGGQEQLGVSDLRKQLESYNEQHTAATARLSDLEAHFEAAVASILGITAEQQPQLLAAALQEQQQLQDVQVQQLAIEQQLGGRDFAVTDGSKHKAKKARLERMSSVWDWLQDSASANTSAAAAAGAQQQPGPAAAAHDRQQQQEQHQPVASERLQQEGGQQQGEEQLEPQQVLQQQQQQQSQGNNPPAPPPPPQQLQQQQQEPAVHAAA